MNRSQLHWDYHLHNLLLNGVDVAGESPCYDDLRGARAASGQRRLRRFDFALDEYRYDTCQRAAGDTPYWFDGARLHFRGRPLARLPFRRLHGDEADWGSERAWWFKRFPTLDAFYDLRLNPINTCANLRHASGSDGELRGCVFCHRCYNQPRASEQRAVVPLAALFADIERAHGAPVFARIAKVMVVTGDLDGEAAMLELLESICHQHLRPRGFAGVFSAVTTLVRSERGLARLAALDDQLFEFPLECFERRATVLGAHKGIDLDEVTAVLARARRHFRAIRLNYLVGLDPLEATQRGFAALRAQGLVDDVISNIFVPYDERALRYRVPESYAMDYVYGYRRILRSLGLAPKRTGTTKDAFSPFEKSVMHDELIAAPSPAQARVIRITEQAI